MLPLRLYSAVLFAGNNDGLERSILQFLRLGFLAKILWKIRWYLCFPSRLFARIPRVGGGPCIFYAPHFDEETASKDMKQWREGKGKNKNVGKTVFMREAAKRRRERGRVCALLRVPAS